MPTAKKKEPSIDLTTLNLLPIPVVLYDQSHVYFANQKALDLFEVPKNKVKSLNQFSIYHFLDKAYHEKIRDRCNAILSGRELPPIRVSFVTFNKRPFFVEAKSNRVWFEDKYVIQSSAIDISEEHKQQLELENSKQLLEKIGGNSLDVIFKLDFLPKSKMAYISKACYKVLGLTQEEIYKNPEIIKSYLKPEDKPLAFHSKEDYLKFSKNASTSKVQLQFKNKLGHYKFLEIVANPVYDKNKEVTGIIGSIRDNSERIQAENLLKEIKSKFDLITNSGNDIITFFTYLPKNKYLYVSPNIERILGYKPAELLNDPNFFLKRILSEKKEFQRGEVEMSLCQKKGSLKGYQHTYKTVTKSGGEVWLENTSTPIQDKEGKINFYLNILKDVTEQKLKEIQIESQYNNYRDLLEISPVAYIIHENGYGVYCNLEAQKLLKLKNGEEILGKNVINFFDEKSKARSIERLKILYKSKRPNNYANYTIIDAEGKKIEVEIKSVFVRFQNKDCILSLINNLSQRKRIEQDKEKMKATASHNLQLENEIKEREAAEKNLIEKTAHLSSIFESSTHLIWSVNKSFQITSFNDNYARVVEQQHGIKVNIGDKVDEFLLKNQETYRNYWYPIYEEAFKGKKLEFEKMDFVDREVHRKVFINPILNENNEINEISCIANDITDSKIYERKLINQTAKLTAIFDSSHHYIWTIDKEERLTSFNKNYFDITSSLYNTKPYLGLVLNRGILASNDAYNSLFKEHYKIAFDGRATSFEVETIDKNFKKVHLEVFLNPIFEKDKVIEVSGIAHNITEKKMVQQKMELSLKEKEVLLREVHHRVKNNMQVVSSILNLQSSYVSDEYALTLLKESQNRIKTMAIIHESLYQNKSFSSVNFSDYVRTLISNIIQSYSSSNEKIKLEMHIEDVILPLDSSIPAGLILNELVTNAIKHAFPGTRTGTITLELKCENNLVFLTLKDDGVGFKDKGIFQNSNSLGLQLVNTLIEQIDGEYKFYSDKQNGTEVQVIFKM